MTNSLCERSIWATANILSLRILKSLIILVPLTFDFEALSSTYWRAAFRREILYFQSKKVIYVRTEEFVIMSSQIMEKQLLLTYFYIFQNYQLIFVVSLFVSFLHINLFYLWLDYGHISNERFILRCGTYQRKELIKRWCLFRSECKTAWRFLEGHTYLRPDAYLRNKKHGY